MHAKGSRQPELYGVAPIGVSRYFALYVTQAGWLILGFYLLANAYWPSTCRPDGFVKVYACSARLAEGQSSWVEAALMTWLWTTPILAVLELMRRIKRHERR